ncbi:MAG: cell envelope integrity protein TolA [Coxiellaceae bacterium]|nr:MAG: cell envelope integrity protein TolA [Coxiellaceae bacterium]
MPKDNTPSYRWSLIIAIALHVVLVVALFVKFALPSVDQPGWQSQAKIVQASIVGPAATAVQRPQPVKQPPPKPKPVTPRLYLCPSLNQNQNPKLSRKFSLS